MRNLLIEANTKDGSKLEHYPDCVKGTEREPKIIKLNPGFGLQIKTKSGLALVFPNFEGLTWQNDFNFKDVKYAKNTELRYKCESGKLLFEMKEETPPPSTSLPAWVTEKGLCIKSEFCKGTLFAPNEDCSALKYPGPDGPDQIYTVWNTDLGSEAYFEPDHRFFLWENNISYEGTWKCDGTYLICHIKENNTEWRSGDVGFKKRVVTTTPVNCKPFVNKKEADEFRLWVNTNYPDIAANIPGLPDTMADKTLSKRGKCTSTHIRTAAKHKINDIALIDLFRKKEVVTQEKNPHEERNKWMEKNKSRFVGGEIKTFISKDNELKIYQKVDKNGFGFRFFPPNDKKELLYLKYSDNSFDTPVAKGVYSLPEEPTNESIKRWLDIMNKTGRVSINEQTIETEIPIKKQGDSPIKKQEDEPIKKKESDTELDRRKRVYKDNLVTTHGLSLTADTIEMNMGKYEVIDLNTDKIYGNPSLFTEPKKDFVYKQKGEVTIEKPQQQNIIDQYVRKGYTAVPCNTSQTNDVLFFVKLHEKHKDIFTTPYCMVRKETFTGTSLEFNDFIVDNDKLRETVTDKKTCRQLINMYKNASDKKFPVENDASFEDAKQYISRCNTQHKFHFVTNKSLEYILASRKKRVGMYGFRD
jgi:hypothetical protein